MPTFIQSFYTIQLPTKDSTLEAWNMASTLFFDKHQKLQSLANLNVGNNPPTNSPNIEGIESFELPLPSSSNCRNPSTKTIQRSAKKIWYKKTLAFWHGIKFCFKKQGDKVEEL